MECTDETIADCQRFYHVDITTLDGASAIRLIKQVVNYIRADESGRPLSSIGVYAKKLRDKLKEEKEESTLVPMSAIQETGGDFTEVTV